MRFILFCLVFVYSNFAASSVNQDLTPPQMIEFDISPKTVDVSLSDQQVTVLMRITDNESGAESPLLTAGSDINSASTGFGSVSLLSGDDLDGVWQGILTIPQGSTAGNWSVSVFPLTDKADNSTSSFGPGSQFDAAFEVVSDSSDITPPELVEFDVSPKVVDVSLSDQQVTVLMRITDNESGAEAPLLTAGSDINSASTGFGSVSLLSGDDLDGVWQGILTIPQGSTAGNWSVSVFPLTDKADNSNSSFGPGSQFDAAFEVVSDSSDITPPELVEFDVSPKVVDVSLSDQQVKVLMRITDNESGAEAPLLTAGSDINSASTGFGSVSLLSGDDLDGVWQGILTIPQGSTAGNWSVSVFPLTDKADNSNSSFGPDSQFDAAFEVLFPETSNTTKDDSLYVLPDINSDGIKEIGLLSVDVLESKVRLQILNGKDKASMNEIVWVDNFSDTTLSLHVIPDTNDNGFDEVGLFGIQDIQNNEGKPQVFVRDLKTGNKVGDVYNWVANWTEVSALVLEDMTGDGISEIAIQGRFEEGNRPQLIVKTGGTNTILATYSYPDLLVSPQYYQHSDINGDGFKEIATFGRLVSNNKIQTKLASGIDALTKLPAYNFPDKWDNISWYRLDDSNGDGVDDWGMFGILREDGRPQLVNKDGVSPVGALRIYAWPAEMQDAQFFRIPDMNNDGVDEVAAAGRRSNNGRYQFQIQDGTDRNVLLANHNLNLSLTSVTYHVLPDLSGDEQVEIGFMGINPQGEYELLVQHGDNLNGEYATYNLGSDWQGAPAITSLGDTDDDGLPDLLIFGQNATGERLVIAAAGNSAPVANAGLDQNITTTTLVTLNASASSDADGDAISYSWSLTSVPTGSSASLSDSSNVSPTFNADLDGTYIAQLIVNDGTVDSTVNTVTIFAASANSAPVANAGADQNVFAGTIVFLNANGSSDADGDGLLYFWSFVSKPVGSLASFDNESAENPSFTPDLNGSFIINLVVSDGSEDSAVNSITIDAIKPSVRLFRESGGFFGGTFDEVAFPYSSSGTVSASVSGIPTPTTYSFATFKLIAEGQNFTITNLLVTDSTLQVVPFFTVISEGYELVNGTEVEFELISPLTRGATVILNFSFEIQETGDTFSSSYTFTSN